MAADVDRKVVEELNGHVYTTDTKSFINQIFPLEPETHGFEERNVINHLRSQNQLSRDGWAGLSQKPPNENAMYGPFTGSCNAIRLACKEKCNMRTSIQWYDRHSKAPKSVDKDAADIRPDVIASLVLDDDRDNNVLALVDDNIRAARKEEKEAADAAVSASATVSPTSGSGGTQPSNPEEKTERLIDIWWQRVHCLVELKVQNDAKSTYDATRQLFSYMRQVFREQINRRFVIGLVLCGSHMTVWLCDKAGVIGTSTPFNIHRSPELFIRVIAGMSLMKYEELGWDTTMRIVPPNTDYRNALYSWSPAMLKNTVTSPYQMRWAIEMPSRDGTDRRETFLTLKALSLLRSEVLYGRGSVVWAVCKADDPPGPQRRIYVLKQCARPSTSAAEGYFYELGRDDESSGGCAQLGTLYSYEDVSIPHYPAKALEILRRAYTQEATSNEDGNRKRPREETKESLLQIACNDESTVEDIQSTLFFPSRRIFSRTLIEPYGWPVKFFKDRLELLVCLRDAIKAHRFMYRRGVLHRDVSTGNILICPLAGDAENTAGRLFDLDYGKQAEVGGNSEIAVKDISPEDINRAERHFKLDYPAGIERAALERLVSFFPKGSLLSIEYVRDLLQCCPLALLQSPLTYADVGLLPEEVAASMPKFDTHESQRMHRTGTGPFMSSELATKTINFGDGKSDLVHDSIHDMESIMWVLIYLCCTRDGPGGNRRKEFGESFNTSEHKMLQAVVFYFFETPIEVMGYRKQGIFKKKCQMEEWLLPIFHDYFTSLKPLVRKWFDILFVCYQYRIYETIHDQFLKAIEEAIWDEEKRGVEENPEIVRATEAELARRRNDLYKLKMEPSGDYPVDEVSQGPSSSTLLQNDQSPSRSRSKEDAADLLVVLTGKSAPDDPFRETSPTPPEAKKLKTESAAKRTTKGVAR
ncbi:hypothetical protein DENSPDRAFT_873979 [Dentipellis sp. KUC8613]|nr:hypothetical protein DENSPDRAFT_873979 [Dentipellis sp. KUC8613]